MSAPFSDFVERMVPGQATAGTDSAWNIDKAKFDGSLAAASYTPNAAITGDASNNRTFKIVNKGQDGSGTTVMASLTTTASLTADNEAVLTLSAVAGALDFEAGDILEFNSDANGTGVADPGGLVVVTLARG
jgi:hypothetical protein